MADVGVFEYEFKAVSVIGGGFEWYVVFRFSGHYYIGSGEANTKEQCLDAAKAFEARKVQEAVK